METIHVRGGIGLQGEVRIQGSKNAALPVLAATLLTGDISLIQNCPRITDVYQMITLLEGLGCVVNWEKDGLRVDSRGVYAEAVNSRAMQAEAISGMRSSLCLLGALLGKKGEVSMAYPGGCIIGKRPIDLHLASLRRMGAVFSEDGGVLRAYAPKGLHGADIRLPFCSVGVTENCLLAAASVAEETHIRGAATEPEVGALCSYLAQCGVRIRGIGTRHLIVQGGDLTGTVYRVPADRIVAGTYMLACLGTGGEVLLSEAPTQHMEAVISLTRSLGGECHDTGQGLFLQASGSLIPIEKLVTAVYPGFPTDLQSVALAVLTKAPGECVVEETIFENRFRVVEDLQSMGACLSQADDRRVQVCGSASLHGCHVQAKELRGGAALVVAGLMAEGETTICGCTYIARGYENICRDLQRLGARIYGA